MRTGHQAQASFSSAAVSTQLSACSAVQAAHPASPHPAADLAHRLRVGGGGGEVALPVQAAKQAAPAVVPVRRVRQAPRHQRLALRGGRGRGVGGWGG